MKFQFFWNQIINFVFSFVYCYVQVKRKVESALNSDARVIVNWWLGVGSVSIQKRFFIFCTSISWLDF